MQKTTEQILTGDILDKLPDFSTVLPDISVSQQKTAISQQDLVGISSKNHTAHKDNTGCREPSQCKICSHKTEASKESELSERQRCGSDRENIHSDTQKSPQQTVLETLVETINQISESMISTSAVGKGRSQVVEHCPSIKSSPPSEREVLKFPNIDVKHLNAIAGIGDSLDYSPALCDSNVERNPKLKHKTSSVRHSKVSPIMNKESKFEKADKGRSVVDLMKELKKMTEVSQEVLSCSPSPDKVRVVQDQ